MAAFTINSNTHKTASTLQALFAFLSDFKNFASILPEDKVENFQYEGDKCSFSIRGITPMTVKLVEKHAYTHILFSSEGLAKFNFSLLARFIGDPQQPGQCAIDLSGDLNPFILKMAESSLTALANTMSLRLSQLQL